MDDRAEIDQLRAAVADLERLRADTLQLLHESGELLEKIERTRRHKGWLDYP